MTRSYKITVIFLVSVFVFGFDQATKFWAINNLMGQSATLYLNGLFQFVYAENPGAFLGLGGGWSREVRFVIFAMIVLFGLGDMVWWLLLKGKLKINLFAYTCILAGGFGNLWDRLFHEDGHVIDFMLIDLGGVFRTGVFNIADVFIVIGFVLAIYATRLEARDGV